jgi:hypothetical protein
VLILPFHFATLEVYGALGFPNGYASGHRRPTDEQHLFFSHPNENSLSLPDKQHQVRIDGVDVGRILTHSVAQLW